MKRRGSSKNRQQLSAGLNWLKLSVSGRRQRLLKKRLVERLRKKRKDCDLPKSKRRSNACR